MAWVNRLSSPNLRVSRSPARMSTACISACKARLLLSFSLSVLGCVVICFDNAINALSGSAAALVLYKILDSVGLYVPRLPIADLICVGSNTTNSSISLLISPSYPCLLYSSRSLSLTAIDLASCFDFESVYPVSFATIRWNALYSNTLGFFIDKYTGMTLAPSLPTP